MNVFHNNKLIQRISHFLISINDFINRGLILRKKHGNIFKICVLGDEVPESECDKIWFSIYYK